MDVRVKLKKYERVFAYTGLGAGMNFRELQLACWANCVETAHDFLTSREHRLSRIWAELFV